MSGPLVIKSITSDSGRIIGKNGRLMLLSQNGSEDATWSDPRLQRYEFESVVEETTLEQSGPIRAVVKVLGKHYVIQSESSSHHNHAAWLPFTMRFYLYAGLAAIKIMHTILYDGDAEKDVIRGIGIRFDVPLKEEQLVDRHVRFSGLSDGIFSEAVQGVTGLRKDPGHEIRKAQVEGRSTQPFEKWDPNFVSHLKWVPSWNDYQLSQLPPDGFIFKKMTKPGRSWITIPGGSQAGGLVYLGGASIGGLAIGMRDFSSRYPTGLEIHNAAEDDGQITAWLYSPSAEPMFLGQYHDGLDQEI